VTPAQSDLDSFRSRVSMAMVKAAMDIQSELTTVAYHGQRSAFARLVLVEPSRYTPPFAQALAAQGLDNVSTDKQIADMVSSVWNGFAVGQ
jgi:hypothetical protein